MEEAKHTLHGLARCTEDECFGGALGKGCFLMMETEPVGRVCQSRYRETQRKKETGYKKKREGRARTGKKKHSFRVTCFFFLDPKSRGEFNS